MKSLYAISPLGLEEFTWKPDCPVHLLYGEYGDFRKSLPSKVWASEVDAHLEMVPKFGYELYSDEKIIQKVCLYLLQNVIKKQYELLGNRL
jgi:hypothetical protein